ncbi:hypothetical protein DSO57_1009411 [Entomophthora muscae]|uniref:Uncharacterized protein n=1 Tax=Entomophthora muscae TaxID=34485 RepID=A0ACC2U4L4_9FUNG|nr:hypothetical protein DSO57_1009411 [Entomophthora muscae]
MYKLCDRLVDCLLDWLQDCQQGNPSAMPSIPNLTAQQFAQLSTNPNFLAMLQQRGINPQHAKNIIYNQIQSANLASQFSANTNMQNSTANQVDLNSAMNNASGIQSNTTIASKANSAPSPAFPKSNMDSVSSQYNQQLNIPASYNQISNPSPMQSNGSEFAQSPAVSTQQHMSNAAQFLNQKQAYLNEAMRLRPLGPIPGQGLPDPRTVFNANGSFSYPQFMKTIEMAKIELIPKVKALIDSCKPFPIREDVGEEEREKIYAFFPSIPNLLKTIDEILPYISVFTSSLDYAKPLILFKALLETQQKCQPQIVMTLEFIENIKSQVSAQGEFVKKKVQKMAMGRMNDPQGHQESPIKQDTPSFQSSLPQTAKSLPGSFVNASPRHETTNIPQPAASQAIRSQEPVVSKPPISTSSAEVPPQTHLPPGPKNQTNFPPKLEETAEPVQVFKSHIPNPEIALRLPTQKTVTPKSDSVEPQKVSLPETPKSSLPAKPEKTASDNVLQESPIKKTRTQKPKTPATPLTKLERLEAEINSARSKFRNQPMQYALTSLKKLKEIDASCQFRTNPIKSLGAGTARFGSSLFYHYTDGPSNSLSELPTPRPVFGFGDLPSKS